jgi:hypothetical protein
MARARRIGPISDPTMRIEIAGKWSAEEFGEFFSQISHLHNLAVFSSTPIEGHAFPPFGMWRLFRERSYGIDPFLAVQADLEFEIQRQRLEVRRELERYLPSAAYALRVTAIEFASPGHIDLLGIGKAVSELGTFITGIVDRIIQSEDRKLARDSAREDIRTKKLENAERLLNVAEKAGLGDEARQALLRDVLAADYFLEGKVLEGKVTDVTSPDDMKS